MINSTYAKSYTEVLTLLRCLNKKKYSKIPKEEIDFLQRNCDKEYKFTLKRNKKLTEQDISKEANAILIILFEKYFASKSQKQRLKTILIENYEKEEERKRSIYNEKEMFKTKIEEKKEETGITKYRENIISKCINAIKAFWRKIK